MTASLARPGAPARAAQPLRRLTAAALLLLAAMLLAAAHPPVAGAAGGESKLRATQAGAVAAGDYSSCVLRGGGHVGCWGASDHGQIGDGSNLGDNAGARSTSGIDDAIQIAASGIHACAIRANRHVSCWGGDQSGQLGDGPATSPTGDRLSPVDVVGIDDATAVTALNAGTCVLRASGNVSCWGANDAGQLGQPLSTASTNAPADVAGLTGAVAVDAGWYHVCAVKGDGTVWCWGYNADGETGQPIDNSSNDAQRVTTPKQVPGITTAVGVSAGVYQTCILLSDGSIRCMGSDAIGEAGLGAATATSSAVPQAVTGLGGKAVQVTVGMQVACALMETGAVRCWGNDRSGQLGDGHPADQSASPVTVPGLTASAVSISRHTLCAIKRNTDVVCWGDDTWGNVGNGNPVDGEPTYSVTPQTVVGATSPYGLVAQASLELAAPATAADGSTATTTLTVRNAGPDRARPSVELNIGTGLGFGELPLGVDAGDAHTALWRPASIPAGESATISLPLVASGPGAAPVVRASIVGDDALNPLRPLARGPLLASQTAQATIAVTDKPAPTPTPAAGGTPQSGSTGAAGSGATGSGADAGTTRTPLAALDPAKLIALAKPKACRSNGAPLRVVFTLPAGATIRAATAAVKGKASAPFSGKLSGAVRLPRKVERAIDASARSSVKVVVAVTLTDGRTTTRTLSVRRCS